jgi:AcrR family transcriptional regulator
MNTERHVRVRRTGALSKTRIVQAAIEILDANGETALTTRALASSLETGSGAIFHHVSGKEELLRAAADRIVTEVTRGTAVDAAPEDSIRSVMIEVFDAIVLHPWVGAQLSREPWQMAILELFEDLGERLRALGVPAGELFDAASTLVSYLLGVASQYAAGARLARDADRAAFLASAVEEWIALRDPVTHPFVHQVATELADHDDRTQFVAGLELIMGGIVARYK